MKTVQVICVALLLCSPFLLAAAADLNVNVDWTQVLRRTNTAATIEVDVMPFLVVPFQPPVTPLPTLAAGPH